MKSKSLLVGASAPFEGPWVNLEEGSWLIQGPPEGVVIRVIGGTRDTESVEDMLRVTGPARIRVILESGEKVFMSVEQVANA